LRCERDRAVSEVKRVTVAMQVQLNELADAKQRSQDLRKVVDAIQVEQSKTVEALQQNKRQLDVPVHATNG
jgi:hypothetical protein